MITFDADDGMATIEYAPTDKSRIDVCCLHVCGHFCFESPDGDQCCRCWHQEHGKTSSAKYVKRCHICSRALREKRA